MDEFEYKECLLIVFRLLLEIYDYEKAIVILYSINKCRNLKI